MLAFALLALLVCSGSATELRFRRDGTFKIVQITDLHYGEGADKDVKSDEVQRTVLAAELPDLVVFSGDMVSGWMNARRTYEGWFEVLWRQLIGGVQRAAVPYATLLGNHDDEAELSRRQILQLDMDTGHGLSLTRQGPANVSGASNYWLDILAPEGAQVAARVWLLDSMDQGCGSEPRSWGCVGGDTVAWFRQQSALLPRVPSVLYVHIPLPEHMLVQGVTGVKDEAVCCPRVNTGLFAAAKEAGVGSIWSGHDHSDDFYGLYEGVVLGFGRKTGYGSYGPSLGRLHGARVLHLRLGLPAAQSETWLALEDGSREYQRPGREPAKGQTECMLVEESIIALTAGADEASSQPELCQAAGEAAAEHAAAAAVT